MRNISALGRYAPRRPNAERLSTIWFTPVLCPITVKAPKMAQPTRLPSTMTAMVSQRPSLRTMPRAPRAQLMGAMLAPAQIHICWGPVESLSDSGMGSILCASALSSLLSLVMVPPRPVRGRCCGRKRRRRGRRDTAPVSWPCQAADHPHASWGPPRGAMAPRSSRPRPPARSPHVLPGNRVRLPLRVREADARIRRSTRVRAAPGARRTRAQSLLSPAPKRSSHDGGDGGTDVKSERQSDLMRRPSVLRLALTILGVMVLLAACQSTTGRTLGENIDDAGITTKVKAKLAAEKISTVTRIDVDTNQGVVALNGTVPSPEMRTRAEQIAREVKGVRDVINNLRVQAAAIR